METYFADFTLLASALTHNDSDLEMLIARRQEGFSLTAEYQKAVAEFKDLLAKVEAKLPENDADLRKLADAASWLEVINFTGAYKAGVTDLMAAVTFNKVGITQVEFVKRGSAPTGKC